MSAALRTAAALVSASRAGAVTMSSREIAELTGSTHDNVLKTVRALVDKGVVSGNETPYIHPQNRQTYAEFRLNYRDTMVVVSGYSVELRARIIDRWQDLEEQEQLQRTPSAAKLTGELAIMECFTRLLRPAPSSQLTMLGTIAKQNGLDPSFLPAYALDAPTDAENGSSLPTSSLTELLRTHGIKIGAAKYNAMLRDAGILTERTRKSTSKGSRNGEKRFWCITERGLAFGKNLISPESPRETQPHWYVDRFPELRRIVSARLLGDEQ